MWCLENSKESDEVLNGQPVREVILPRTWELVPHVLVTLDKSPQVARPVVSCKMNQSSQGRCVEGHTGILDEVVWC